MAQGERGTHLRGEAVTDSEILAFIRREVARQTQVILNAQAGKNTIDKENIDLMYPGAPSVTERPVMHPYGLASRAPEKTLSVVARVGEHSANRMVIGHRDKDRPTDLEEGETILYSVGKMSVIVRKDKVTIGKGETGVSVVVDEKKVTIGKGDTQEPGVLGDALASLLSELLDILANHTHGPPGTPPAQSAQITQIKVQQVDAGKFLAEEGKGL